VSKQDDLRLLKWLKADDLRERENAFEFIYRNFYAGIEAYVLQNKGTREEARDIFQDGLIVLYNQVLSGAFREQSTIKTYLYSICRNIWYKKLGKKKPQADIESLKETKEETPEADEILIGNEREQLVERLLNKLTEECNQILKLFYFDKLSMKKIKATLNLASEQVAKNKKMKCLKKLRVIVAENQEYIELLKHYN
jgi:RNA polymerase sigma factor (sigma-70 family)